MSSKHTPPVNKSAVAKALSSLALVSVISACNTGGSGNADVLTGAEVELTGSVGDGPVTGATITLSDSSRVVNNTTFSGETAAYSVIVPSDAKFPVTVKATGGTDVVTGMPLDFTLESIALKRTDQTVNLNPFTTIIVESANQMPGGVNAGNLRKAADIIAQQFSFGLDPALIPDPINTPITPDNVASIVKSSEALGETIRRIRDAFITVGNEKSADAIIQTLAGDLSDGFLDGVGPGADPLIAATASALSAQVLVEALQNAIYVNGSDATGFLDSAITLTEPAATMDTSQVIITEGILRQARIALAAAQVYLPANSLADLISAVDTLHAGITSAQAAELIPADSRQVLSGLSLFPTASATTIAAVNDAVRSGTSAAMVTDGTTTTDGSTTGGTTDTTSGGTTDTTTGGGTTDTTTGGTTDTTTGGTTDTTTGGTTDTTTGGTTDTSTGGTTDTTPAIPTADFYVSLNGSDSNNGSEGSPFRSITKAIAAAGPGDLIFVRGGTYRLSGEIRITKSGTSGSPIRLFAYPGERPVLDASGFSGQDSAIWMTGANYWHIKGLEIANSPFHGVVVTGSSSYNVLEALNIHGSGRTETSGSGLHVTGSASNNLFLNIDSHHNVDTTLGNADGFAVKSPDAKNNKFRGCRAWNNSDDGWDFWTGPPTVIENSYAWRNGYDDSGRALGDGNGFKLGKGNGGHRVINSMSWGNKQSGFKYNGSTGPNYLYNNIGWKNGYRDFVFRAEDGSVLRNNISVTNNNNLDGSDHKYNSWNLSVTVNSDDFVSMDDSVITGPRAADGSIPANGFLKLRQGSDLIDAGTNVGLPYKGSAPDLGAVETNY